MRKIMKAVVVSTNVMFDFIGKYQRGIIITVLLGIATFFTIYAALHGGLVMQITDACGVVKSSPNPFLAPVLIALVFAGFIANLESEEGRRERLYGHRHFSRIHRL